MLRTLKLRFFHGKLFIKDIKAATVNSKFRGLPIINASTCTNCQKCISVCPSKAILKNPLSIDLGQCIFCGACADVCESSSIKFSNFHKLGSSNRDALIVGSDVSSEVYMNRAFKLKNQIYKIFKRSLKLRQVSAGGCNACEMELHACSNINFDMGRYGIDFVASPRHADGLVITGPITENMAYALEEAYKAVPEPKLIILCGTCAIGGGVFNNSASIDRSFLEKHKIDLYIPGCPVHPLTIINALLKLIKYKYSDSI